MLPLVSFGIVYWLLGRKVKPLSIIGGMALGGHSGFVDRIVLTGVSYATNNDDIYQ
ncbi:PTS system protein [Klebsiella pneumoniae]|nr:PTS system protein [Klebsiella pneumoniae]